MQRVQAFNQTIWSSIPTDRPVLVIMAKAPRIGLVKSRLAAEIGWVNATAFQRTNLAAMTQRLAHDPRWTTLLAVAPDRLLDDRLLPTAPLRLLQGAGNLGDRMARVFHAACPRPALIVGADIASADRGVIAAAFKTLCSGHPVIGPSGDGGYWLIGWPGGIVVQMSQSTLFQDVRWSTEHAMADTMASLPGPVWRIVATHHDVDRHSDHRRWRQTGGGRVIL